MEKVIDDLYNKLIDEKFVDHSTGNLHFPVYIYTYDPEKEYGLRKGIKKLKERLIRPNNFVDSLVINIYESFIEFLKSDGFIDETYLDLFFKKEDEEGHFAALELLKEKVGDTKFFEYLHEKIETHRNTLSRNKKVFVFVHGFGTIYPFIRVSRFLNNFEQYILNYKMIVFYPGTYKENHYVLFNDINDKHLYRATHLNEVI